MVKKQRKKPGLDSVVRDVFKSAGVAGDAIPIPVAVVDGNLMVKYLNRAFARRFSLRKKELGGKKWNSVFPGCEEEIRKVIKSGRRRVIKMRPEERRPFFEDACISPLRVRGSVVGVLVSIVGINAPGRAGGKVLARQLIHRLRTPLATAEMAVEMLCAAFSRGDSARVETARAVIKRNLDIQRLYMENIAGFLLAGMGPGRKVSIDSIAAEEEEDGP